MLLRNISLFTVCLLLCQSLLLGQDVEEESQFDELSNVRIAVIELHAPDIPISGAAILTDFIRQELLKGEGITVLDRINTNKVLEEQRLHMSGIISDSTLVQAGKLLGVEKIIFGKIGNLGNLHLISLQMVDVETGSIERVVEENYIGQIEQLTTAVRAAAQRLLGIGGENTIRETTLRISSTPAGARAYLDDLFEGSTPLTVNFLNPGSKNLRISAPGYVSWSQDIDIAFGETKFVDAELIKMEQIGDYVDISGMRTDGRKSLIVFSGFYTIWFIEGFLATLGIDSERPYVGGALIGAPLGFFTAMNFTKNKAIPKSRTSMIISSTMWGSAWGLSAAALFESESARPAIGLSLLGGTTALYMSAKYTSTHAISGNRVSLINLGSFLGTLLGLGVPFLINIDDGNVYLVSMIAGGIGGGLYAFKLTRRFDEVSPEISLSLPKEILNLQKKGIRRFIPKPELVFRPLSRNSAAKRDFRIQDAFLGIELTFALH